MHMPRCAPVFSKTSGTAQSIAQVMCPSFPGFLSIQERGVGSPTTPFPYAASDRHPGVI